MSAAVFPTYWLARRIVRPSFALLTAAAAVATPAMVYHASSMSGGALAYPVFLPTVAVLAKALANRHAGWRSRCPLVSLVAVATRVQFLDPPRSSMSPQSFCAAAGTTGVTALPTALPARSSSGASSSSRARSARTAAQRTCVRRSPAWRTDAREWDAVPYALSASAVVPGRDRRPGYMLVRPRSKIDRAVAALTVGSRPSSSARRALVSTAEAHRPLERYLFLLHPARLPRVLLLCRTRRAATVPGTSRSGSSVRSHSRDSS